MKPFADGSISFRLYPQALGPTEALDEMKAQASLAVESGFDGLMVSERHGGIAGKVPNPLQITGWLASGMDHGWVTPCPVLALFRAPALIVEEVAWLAVNYPDRVGVGLGTGGNELDFELFGDAQGRSGPPVRARAQVRDETLVGNGRRRSVPDPAVARCVEHPIRRSARP